MKAITTFFIAGASLCTITAAQAQGPAFGLKGGFNYTTLASDEADDEHARIGFNAGVFARTAPNDPIGLQVELLYSTKGTHSTYSGPFGFVDQDVDFSLNYIELPVLASFRLAEVLDLQVGGYAAYLAGATLSTSGDLGDSSDELDRDAFTSMDYGLAAGVGFNVGTTQVGVRYLQGLAPVAQSDASELLLGDATNRCAQVYLAIGLGGKE